MDRLVGQDKHEGRAGILPVEAILPAFACQQLYGSLLEVTVGWARRVNGFHHSLICMCISPLKDF